ncbi:hypothetical protein D3C80_1891910 [compost metagenome]
MHVEPDVDAFIFEALDPPVDLAQRLGIELLGVAQGPAIAEDVRAHPGRIMVMQPHQVEAQCRQALGLLLDRLVG